MWQAPVVALGIAAAGRDRRARATAAREPDPDPVVHLAGARLPLRAAAGASRDGARAEPSGRGSARSRAARGGSSRSWSVPRTTGSIPDNYQEDRQDVIAHRTSPTNIGLQLLSTLAACDFGYISYAGVLDRLEPTFDTLLRMQRYRGHFYNWYDTQTLAPLVPAYISTVDSGNLAGYLLTLRSGLASLADTGAAHRRQRARRARGCDQPLRGRGGRAQARARDERSEARARQPAHAAGPPPGAPSSSGGGCSPQLEERLQAVSILFHDHRGAAARSSGPSSEALPAALTKPRRGSSVPPPSSRRGSSSSNGSPAG